MAQFDASFESQIKNFQRLAMRNVDAAIRGVSIKLFGTIIEATPVDTGRLRNNWFASTAAPSSETTTYTAQTGAAAISRMTKFINANPSAPAYTLANNMPYAMAIEFGHSKVKRPEGMVRVNTARFQTLLDMTVRELGL